MSPRKATLTALLFTLCLLLPLGALTLPRVTSVTGSDDDARITLRMPSQGIIGDERTRCTVQIDVSTNEVSFSDGDTIVIQVIENDWIGDDEIWSRDVRIHGAPRAFSETYDCYAALGRDAGDAAWEVYATAHVTKDACGL